MIDSYKEVEGLFFADAATRANVFTLIVAHIEDATTNLFNMNKLFYDNLPPEIKPMLKASNAQELVFENPTKDPVEKKRNPGLRSRIRCVTAGSRGVGRSFTLRNVHCSESAFWPNMTENMLGILQAVPDDKDTCVVMESTANGYNEFKTFWDGAVSGENAFRPVFLAWYLDPDYRRPVPPGTEWAEDEEQMRAVKRKAQSMMDAGRVIRVYLSSTDYMEICYADSLLLRRLAWWPYVQLGLVFGFFLIRYWRRHPSIGYGRHVGQQFFDSLRSSWERRTNKHANGFNSSTHQSNSSANTRSESDWDYNARRKAQQEEVDRILDKIRRSGYDSLTREEKQRLFDNSRK